MKTLTTVDDFIAFFEAIPEEKWCAGEFEYNGRCCTMGQLGVKRVSDIASNAEAKRLQDILGRSVTCINDGGDPDFPQSTPRARILAALQEIKDREKGFDE